MLSVTPNAAREILAAAVRSNAAGMALRVAARQTADGSIEYGMGFDEPRDDDAPAEFDGLTVLVGSPSLPLLEATVLDFVEVAPDRYDFIFMPLSTSLPGQTVAGCGTPAARAPGGCGGGGGSGGGCGSCGGG